MLLTLTEETIDYGKITLLLYLKKQSNRTTLPCPPPCTHIYSQTHTVTVVCDHLNSAQSPKWCFPHLTTKSLFLNYCVLTQGILKRYSATEYHQCYNYH